MDYHMLFNSSMPPPRLLKILLHFRPRHLHHCRILHRARHRNWPLKLTPHAIFHELPQYSPQRLAGPRLRNHAFPLDDAAQGGDGTDLLAH